MAKKSKTQRAKASARRAEKKAQAAAVEAVEEVVVEEEPKRKLFSRKEKEPEAKAPEKVTPKKIEKKADKPDGMFSRLGTFIKEVRSELRRVTWPTRQDVIRWSGVVVVALAFFSLYVFVLDNAIVTPLLYAISGLGA